MWDNAPNKHHRLTNKRPSATDEFSLLDLLPSENPQIPKHCMLLPMLLVNTPELNRTILLLRVPHA